MNISSIPIQVLHEKDPTMIDIFITDTDEMIKEKIVHAIEPKFPTFVIFPKNFDMKKLLEKNEIFTFLNLFSIPSVFRLKPYEKIIDINFKLLDELLERFNIEQLAMYEMLLFRLYLSENLITKYVKMTEKKKKPKLPSVAKLPSSKPIPKKPETKEGAAKPIPKIAETKEGEMEKPSGKKPGSIVIPIKKKVPSPLPKAPTEVDLVLSSKSEMVMNFINYYDKHPNYALIPPQNNLIIRTTIQSLKKKWTLTTTEWQFKWILNRNKDLSIKIDTNLKLSITFHEKFTSIIPLETTSLEETGKVVFLEVETQETSTGMIFNQLQLNENIPVAKYKDFYKIYENVEILEDVSSDVLENNELYVYRYEKRRGKKSVELVAFPQIHVQNTSFGLMIQVLLLLDSSIPTIEKVFELLHLPSEVTIRKQYNRGLLGNFTLFNPKPKNYPSQYHYASLQSPIFSNLIMNNALFEKFLYVNDSDKIGRDTNSSAIYFHTSSSSSEKENQDNIKVGNWKKDSTRFGDLSALLVPITTADNTFQIQCKILRSFNQDAVDYFQYLLSRLLVMYNESLLEQIKLFQTFLPNYRPYQVSKPMLSDKDLLLTKVEPLIFRPNDYTRGCQNKPPVIVEDVTNLKPEKVLQFPKYTIDFKGEQLKPRYYYCEDGVPGYIQMNVTDHPFDGKAPCCYGLTNLTDKKIEARLKKNEKDEKIMFPSLYEGAEKEVIGRDKPVQIRRFAMYTPTNEYKVLNRLGQFGNIPSSLSQFLQNINVNEHYYRVGISMEWKYSSILGCGIYASILHEINQDESKAETIKYMPIETEARRKFGSICFNIVAQENCSSIESVKDYVLNFKNKLDVRKLYNAIQYFFKINLLVVNTKGEWVKPNSCFSFCSHFFPQRPVLFLYEHANDLRYEIIARREGDKILPYFETDSIWTFIYKNVLLTLTGNRVSSVNHREEYSWIFNENVEIEFQILNKIGQVQILLLKYKSSIVLPVYFENPIAPFAVPTTEKISNIPDSEQIENFVQEVHFDSVEKKDEQGVYILDQKFCIPCRGNNDNVPKKPHNVYYFVDKEIISKTWSNQIGDFTYTNLLKDYLLILFGQFIKENEVKESISVTSLFIDTHIHWTSSYNNNWKQFHPLFDRNPMLYNGEALMIPEELEYSIRYFLDWYYRNKYEYMLALSEQRELPSFYLHNNQFNFLPNHTIQKSEKRLSSHVYNNLYLFSMDELMDPTLLKEKTIYFHYDMFFIRQFFIMHFREENRQFTRNYIYTVLHNYYETNHICFSPKVISKTGSQTLRNVSVKEKDSFFFVFYSFP